MPNSLHSAHEQLALCLVALFCVSEARSVEPPREVMNAFSRDLTIIARSDPATNETTVYRVNPDYSLGKVLWKFPKWFSGRFYVSNDGKNIVAQEEYLPLDAGDESVLLTFIRQGKIIREITVKQLLGSSSKLRRTFPSYAFKFGPTPSGPVHLYEIPKLTPTPSGSDSHVLFWGFGGLYGIDDNGFAFVDSFAGFFIFDVATAKCIFPPNNRINPPSEQ